MQEYDTYVVQLCSRNFISSDSSGTSHYCHSNELIGMAPCQTCESIDLADVSKRSINESFAFEETYPLNHNLFICHTPSHGILHPVDGLVLYHESLDSLRVSAASCELCHLVQDQVDEYIRNSEVAVNLGFKYASTFELWICGTSLSGIFQVLGYNKADAENNFNKSASYAFLASFGTCVDECGVTSGEHILIHAC
jgi:hypothetical protein